MQAPFSAEEFLSVFRHYNLAVWPAQVALLLVAIACAASAYHAALKHSWRSGQVALVLLSTLWFWTAFVYHRMFFVEISRAGRIFGSLFVAQGVLLLLSLWENGKAAAPLSRANLVAGTSILVYALVLYPAVSAWSGHHFPSAPTFGAPCPVTIFTFGIFCLIPAKIPKFAQLVPVLWTVIASGVVLAFGMHEDLGLIGAAIAALLVLQHTGHPRRAVRFA